MIIYVLAIDAMFTWARWVKLVKVHLYDICTYMTIPFSNSLFTRDKSVVYEHSVHLGQLMAGPSGIN